MATPAPFDPASSSEWLFLPLADPERRQADPVRALQAARDLRILISVGELGAVRQARLDGSTWSDIGDALGMSKQAAQQRFGLLVDFAAGADVEGLDLVAGPRPPRNRPGPKSGSRQQPKRRR